MATIALPTITPEVNKERKARKTIMFLAVNNGVGVGSPVTTYGFMKAACSLKEHPNFGLELINETDLALPGKAIVKMNDGVKVSPYTATFQANDIAIPASILSQDLSLNPVFKFGQTISDFGHVLIMSFAPDGTTIAACTLLCRASAQFLQAPGNSEGGNDLDIQFYSDYDKLFQSKGGIVLNIETWYQDGVNIVNAAAPNAVLTAFVLGTGNGSGLTYVASSALVMDTTGGTHSKYVPVLMLKNATTGAWSLLRDTTDYTFTLATGTITLAVAPPNNSKLVAIWASTEANAINSYSSFESWQTFQGV